MMKHFSFLFILLLAFSLSSCKKNDANTPDNPDEQMQQKIIGSWAHQYNNHKFTYYSNAVFIDSQFVNGDRDELLFVALGKFKIRDGILHKYDISVQYLDSSKFGLGLEYRCIPKKVSFYDDKFSEVPVQVLSPLNGETKQELWGTWSGTEWAHIYKSNESYTGRIIMTYQFERPTFAKWWSEYPDGNYKSIPNTSYCDIMYCSGLSLEINGSGRGMVTIEYRNNKMIWILDKEQLNYHKVK